VLTHEPLACYRRGKNHLTGASGDCLKAVGSRNGAGPRNMLAGTPCRTYRALPGVIQISESALGLRVSSKRYSSS
jgi:hypothetical protein